MKSATALRIHAVLFLALGCLAGIATGAAVGGASLGGVTDVTMITEYADMPTGFNWLLFSIFAAAGLVACSVLLAASHLASLRSES